MSETLSFGKQLKGANYISASEKNAVIASAEVECATGCPVIIHPGRDAQSPFEIVRIYQEAGGHVNRVVMSHLDSELTQQNTTFYHPAVDLGYF